MPGVFDLRTPGDLLAKLRRELERLRAEPNNADHAYNFFVTAEHMLDWVYPGRARRTKKDAARDANVLLHVVSQLANGAKHFELYAPPSTSRAVDSGRAIPIP